MKPRQPAKSMQECQIDTERDSPFRRLDWRWQMAEVLLSAREDVQLRVKQADRSLFECMEFRRWLDNTDDPSDLGTLQEHLQGYHGAWLLSCELVDD